MISPETVPDTNGVVRGPWVNQRDPISDKWTNRDFLNWYDGFNVDFFISPDAEVKWAMDFT